MRIPHFIHSVGLFLLTLAGLTACSPAPSRPGHLAAGEYSYAVEYLRWQIAEEMRKHKVVGLSIALVDDQTTLWSEGFGLADRESNKAATEHTLYRTGSVSMLLTASAVMQLVEQGEMRLDDPLSEYLPEFSVDSRFPDSGPITLRQLLTHHSGLPLAYAGGMWSEPPPPFTDLVHEIRGAPLAFAPGSVLAYSFLGYSLLGHAVQNAAGEAFATHMTNALLRPSGMNSARFSPYPPAGATAAKAYAADKQEAQQEYPLRDVPAGGLNASVLDLAAFMKMLYNDGRVGDRSLLQPSSIAEMWRAQNTQVALDMDQEIGLGWVRAGLPGAGLLLQHAGATLYHRAYVALLPEQKLGVVLLANTGDALAPMVDIGNQAMRLLWEAKTGRRLPEQTTMAHAEVPAAYATDPEGFVGHFDTHYGFASVRRDGDPLAVVLNGQPLTLRPKGEGRFAIEGKILGMIPAELEQATLARAMVAGHELLLSREDDGRFVVLGERLEPVPIPQAWHARLGEYRILDAERMLRDWAKTAKIRALVRDGFLLVEVSGKHGIEQTLVLEPVSDTRAVVRGIGTGRGGMLEVVNDRGEESIRYSGLEFRREE